MRSFSVFFVGGVLAASIPACSTDSGAGPAGGGGTAGSGGGNVGGGGTGAAGNGGTAAGGGSGSGGSAVGGSSGTGGGAGTGGSSGTGGGGTGGTGGTGGGDGGTGGIGGNTGFVCPPGSESMTVTLPANAGSALPNIPPDDDFNGENLEGPVWIDGTLYASEIRFYPQPHPGRILRIDASGNATLFGTGDEGTNGLAVDGQGRLIAAVQKDGSISRFDLANPTAPPVPIVSMYNGVRFNSPNDLALRSDGNIYFSDPNYQAPSPAPQAETLLYRIDPAGNVTALSRSINVNQDDPRAGLPMFENPNGVTLSKDENALYVGYPGGLHKFVLMPDGSVGSHARVNAINGGVDGLGKDCAGNLYVTNGQNVVVLGPNDASIGTINVGANVTNVAFGGPENKTLFVTSLQPPALRRVELNVPGYPY